MNERRTRSDIPAALPPTAEPMGASRELDWWHARIPELMVLLERVRRVPGLPEDLSEDAGRLIQDIKSQRGKIIDGSLS